MFIKAVSNKGTMYYYLFLKCSQTNHPDRKTNRFKNRNEKDVFCCWNSQQIPQELSLTSLVAFKIYWSIFWLFFQRKKWRPILRKHVSLNGSYFVIIQIWIAVIDEITFFFKPMLKFLNVQKGVFQFSGFVTLAKSSKWLLCFYVLSFRWKSISRKFFHSLL